MTAEQRPVRDLGDAVLNGLIRLAAVVVLVVFAVAAWQFVGDQLQWMNTLGATILQAAAAIATPAGLAGLLYGIARLADPRNEVRR